MKWWTTYRILSEMNERLRWSAEEIRRLQMWKLRELIQYAYYHSPFYHRFYDQHGVHPDAIQSRDDIKKLPRLDKDILRRTDPMEVVTVKPDSDWTIEVTSGSTGEPLRVYRTWRDLYCIKAKVIRAFQQTGFRFTHRQAVLKSSTESLTGRHWFESFGILRKYWLSVTDSPEYNLQRLRFIEPQHVHGYPSGLLSIAELLHTRGEILPIPIICTGAEVLDQTTRWRIRDAFKAEIFDLYATRETGNVAWECKAHQGLHVNDDAFVVELIDENGEEVADGEEGELVITYLDAFDFPFIRYRIGDRAVRKTGECSCSVQFSLLQNIIGRSDSRIRLPSGEWFSGLVFQELRTAPWVSAFRIIQDGPVSIRLQVVPRRDFHERELAALVTRTSELVRGQLQVMPEVIKELERDQGGKVRAVICNLPDEMKGILAERSSKPAEHQPQGEQ